MFMIIHNDLFLKLPEGKSPFIGVSYRSEASNFAELTNQDLVNYMKREYELFLELYSAHVNIRIQVRGMVDIRYYSNVTYNPDQLSEWIKAASLAKTINFGHLIDGKIVMVWKMGKNFYFPIKYLYVIDPQDAKVVRTMS